MSIFEFPFEEFEVVQGRSVRFVGFLSSNFVWSYLKKCQDFLVANDHIPFILIIARGFENAPVSYMSLAIKSNDHESKKVFYRHFEGANDVIYVLFKNEYWLYQPMGVDEFS